MAGHECGERPKAVDREQRLKDLQVKRLRAMDRRLRRMAAWAFGTEGAYGVYHDIVAARECIQGAVKRLAALKADAGEG